MAISERVGIPTIICFVFGYLYFMKLDKVIEKQEANSAAIAIIDSKMTFINDAAKIDREEIKRELRRFNYTGSRRDR